MSKFVPVATAFVLAIVAAVPLYFANAAVPKAKNAEATSSTSATGSHANDPLLAKVGYSFGYMMGKGNRDQITDLDVEQFVEGFRTSYKGDPSKLTEEEMRTALTAYKDKHDREEASKKATAATAGIEIGKKYLAENAKKAGVKTTASGLQYEVLKEGTGASPKATDPVKVHYEGKLLDGTVFDSSVKRGEPVTFPLNQVIPGWTEGVQLMKEGAKYRFTIPSALAYGEAGAGGSIPPNSTLVFEVELLKVNPPKEDAPAVAQ